jgi:hypothetical protein
MKMNARIAMKFRCNMMAVNSSIGGIKMVMTPSPAEKRAAIEEVLQSTTFLRSGQLQKFLRFICEMEITGRADQISEYLIGIEALGQAPDYSPTENAVVRRRAMHLRKKLEEAYATELADAKLRINLPKGRYIPRFVPVEPAESQVEATHLQPAADVIGPGAKSLKIPFKAYLFAFAFFSMGMVADWLLFRAFPSRLEATGAVLVKSGVVYEAEADKNSFNGRTKASLCSTCSGGARVRNIGFSPLNYMMLNNVTVAARGNHMVTIYYLLEGDRSFFVSVNGGPGIEVPVKGNNWLVPASVSIVLPLENGSNTIKLYNENSYAPDLDVIAVD